jgi:cell division protein ZapA
VTPAAAPITVHILDKEYKVACTPEERKALQASAQMLDGKMREIRNQAGVVGLDRVAVMAALNMAHELLQLRGQSETFHASLGQRLKSLEDKLASRLPPAQ